MDEKLISYEAMKIIGLSYEDAIKEGYKPTIMSLEDSKYANKDLLASEGISDEDYLNIHNEIKSNAKNYATNLHSSEKFDANVNPLHLKNNIVVPQDYTIINPELVGLPGRGKRQLTLATDYVQKMNPAELFDAQGGLMRVMNKEQEAESYGNFVDENGQLQSLDVYQSMDYLGNRFRHDQKTGEKKMLVLGKDFQNPSKNIWIEKSAEEFHKGSITRGMNGPTEQRTSAIANGIDHFVNTGYEQNIRHFVYPF